MVFCNHMCSIGHFALAHYLSQTHMHTFIHTYTVAGPSLSHLLLKQNDLAPVWFQTSVTELASLLLSNFLSSLTGLQISAAPTTAQGLCTKHLITSSKMLCSSNNKPQSCFLLSLDIAPRYLCLSLLFSKLAFG